MWIMKGLSVLLFAIVSIVVSIVAITSVAVFVTSPFVLLDREGRSMLGTILGYISIVSLSSIFMIVMLNHLSNGVRKLLILSVTSMFWETLNAFFCGFRVRLGCLSY